MIGYGLALQLFGLLFVLLEAGFKKAKASICFTALSIVASLLLIAGYADLLFSHAELCYVLTLPSFIGSADIVIDAFAAFMGLIFAFGSIWGILYAHAYIKTHSEEGTASHLFFLALMLLSMHLVLMLRHSLLFMLAWELMSLSSFFAILYDRHSQETISSALYYFVMMHIGAAVLLLGFGLLYMQSGTLNFGEQPIYGLAKWLLLIGFAFKAGFFPFYSWLPKAHPVAPAHLSGMMSGLMIKTGIFGIVMVMLRSSWQPYEIYLLLAIALITAFNGVIHALAEANIKKALAYSSIENIGIIGIALCLWLLGLQTNNAMMASLGFASAMLHLLNHSLFKPLLFYLSGNVLVATHSLNQDSLGGLGRNMPRTAGLFLMGSAAISALPLMNGFISEFGIFLSSISGFRISNLSSTLIAVVTGAGLAFVSALALIAFSKNYSIVFGGEPRSKAASDAREVSIGMLISPLVLALSCLVFGLFGGVALLIIRPLEQMFGLNTTVLNSFSLVLNSMSVVMLMLLGCFAVLYLLKSRLSHITKAGTWGCAYAKPSSRMQYTGLAFINPLAYFLKPFVRTELSANKSEGYFPQKIEYQEELQEYLDTSVIASACKAVKRVFACFDSIHNGKTNSYITYLLLALLALLFWVLGVSQ
ncbi:MAG: proton-conducting transporter membrane subunit [Candidatus Cloacimonetes bacterium]|nr:proton-conducting transporter membrane subunit [Candidatus Cloacimonadota bacterium]